MLDAVRTFAFGSPVEKAASGPLPNLGLAGTPPRRLAGTNAKRYSEAYGGSDAIDWVMDCVELIAETASNAQHYFERDGKRLATDDTADEYDEKAPADLVNLFDQPNPFMDYTELIELAVTDFLLAGEFMWLKFRPDEAGKPLAIYRLAPSLVEIELNRQGVPGKYIYTAPGGKPVKFDPDDVVHCKRPNPHDPWRGLSVIAGNPRMYDIELALTESVAQYYEQGTRLSGVLESDRPVPPKAWEKIKRQFAALYGGQRNAYKVAMLERGLKFREISGTAVEAQFAELTNLSKARIAKAFRVPLPLLGEVGSSVDRQAAREAQRIFDNKTMRPFLNRMQKQISKGLSQAWGLDFCIDYEYVMPIEDAYDLADVMSAIPGIQVKDLRKQLRLPPLAEQKAEWAKIDDMILNVPSPGDESGHPNAPGQHQPGPKTDPTKVPAFDANDPSNLPSTAQVQKALRENIRETRRKLREVQNGSS